VYVSFAVYYRRVIHSVKLILMNYNLNLLVVKFYLINIPDDRLMAAVILQSACDASPAAT